MKETHKKKPADTAIRQPPEPELPESPEDDINQDDKVLPSPTHQKKTRDDTAPTSSSVKTKNNKKRNAFTELMTRKKKHPKSDDAGDSSPSPSIIKRTFFNPRGALIEYITHPERFPPSTVLRVTDNTVLIKDMFPKATVHLLLLPRSKAHYDLHPHEAFEDLEFLAMMKEEAASAAKIAAAELGRRMSLVFFFLFYFMSCHGSLLLLC